MWWAMLLVLAIICWSNVPAHDASHDDCHKHSCGAIISGLSCFYTCSFGSADDLDLCLGYKQLENNCSNSLALVSVTYNVSFDNKTIPRHWMKSSSVHPTLLKLYLDNVDRIADHAFASVTFSKLQVLILLQMQIETLHAGTLFGLTALRELRLDNVRMTHLPDFLHGVANKLNLLEITGALSVDSLALLSGVALPVLKEIRLRLNVRNTVGATVFHSTTSLSIVDMQNCRIERIDRRAFFPVRNTLMYLNLVGNRLKTLAADTFDYLLPSAHLTIYLFDNQWSCECTLLDLQRIVDLHPDNFPGPISCTHPPNLMGHPIRTTTFCSQLSDQHQVGEHYEPSTCGNASIRMVSRVQRNIALGNMSVVLHPQQVGIPSRITVTEQVISECDGAINRLCIYNSTSTERVVPLDHHRPSRVYLLCTRSDRLQPACMSYFLTNANNAKSVWLTNSVRSTFLVGIIVSMLIVMTLSFLVGTIVFRPVRVNDTHQAANGPFSEHRPSKSHHSNQNMVAAISDNDESTTQYDEIDYAYLHLATVVEPQYLAMLESEHRKF